MSLPVLFVTISKCCHLWCSYLFARFNLIMIHSFPPMSFSLTLVSIFSISLSFSPALVQTAPPRRQSLVQRRVDPRYMVSSYSQPALHLWSLLHAVSFLNNYSLPVSALHGMMCTAGKGSLGPMWWWCGSLRLLELTLSRKGRPRYPSSLSYCSC